MFTIILCIGAGIAVLGSAVHTARTIDRLLNDRAPGQREARLDPSV